MGQTPMPPWVATAYERATEAELGRADEPQCWLTSDGNLVPIANATEILSQMRHVRGQPPLVCTPTAELAGNTGTTLGEFFFWGQNVEDDDSPDYLAITRDVVGG